MSNNGTTIEIGDGSEQLRYDTVPEMNTPEELADYCRKLIERDHDYNTSAVASAMAALAAFRLLANRLGVTGFQAGYTALSIPGAINGYNGPYGIVKAEDMLYPQYGGPAALAAEYEEEWREWAREEAQKKLAEHPEGETVSWTDEETGEHHERPTIHPNVRKHWEKLAA